MFFFEEKKISWLLFEVMGEDRVTRTVETVTEIGVPEREEPWLIWIDDSVAKLTVFYSEIEQGF